MPAKSDALPWTEPLNYIPMSSLCTAEPGRLGNETLGSSFIHHCEVVGPSCKGRVQEQRFEALLCL